MGAFSGIGNFAQGLLDGLNSLTGIKDNKPGNLNDLLGEDFLSKVDQTAQRQYIGSGYVSNVRPREMQVLLQEPDVTIVIKKRMFSSLSENFKPELMDDSEKLFYRASKKLFDNKCRMIAAYEQLTKVERVIEASGAMDQTMLPLVFAGMDNLKSVGFNFDSKTESQVEMLRKVSTLGNPSYRTNWVTTGGMPAADNLGEGTGTMEITNVSAISCTVSTHFNQGSGSLTIEDPNKMMIITTGEIENAIRQCTGAFTNNLFFKFSEHELNQTIDKMRWQLNDIRKFRGASRITFYSDQYSLLQHKIRAVIDEEGREINFSFDGGFVGFGSDITIDPSAYEGLNGLQTIKFRNSSNPAAMFMTSTSEEELFTQIIKNMFQLFALKKSTEVTDVKFNKKTNAVRKKMFLHYANKPMIQPMDVVHFFISSKTSLDPRTALNIGKSLSGEDIVSSIDNTITNINNLTDSFGGNKVSDSIWIEKNSIAGPDIPMWLWTIMRNDFTRQAAGTHVFAGIVTSAQHSYEGSGKYTLKVSATDNAGYFKLSRININPAQSIFNGDLYDPLTPFDLEFNPSTGFLQGELPPLLKENLNLLNSGALRFKNGANLGLQASQQTWQTGDIEKLKTNKASSFRRKLDDPDGFVYRWKEGIQSKTLLGVPHPNSNTETSDVGVKITKNPFAGQDSMNVLSLLVTGQPYNFNTFMKSAIQNGGFSSNDLTNTSGASSYFRGLLNDLSKKNSIWGNFVPFKKLIINETAYSYILSSQSAAVTANNRLSSLLQERGRKFDLLVNQGSGDSNPLANNPQLLGSANVSSISFNDNYVSSIDATIKLGTDIINIDAEIAKQKQEYTNSVTPPNLQSGDAIRVFGDDISYDPGYYDGINSSPGDMQAKRIALRNKVNYLTQRRLWKVKGNIDDNLFIVDDSYDKNYDIMAFEKSLQGNMELFNSTYTDIASQIDITAKVLGLEIYADTQGHIQARSPQYNRMPSSVFSDMVNQKDRTGIQIFPAYLESLFVNQVKGLADQVEVLEDKIRLYATVLGYADQTDTQAKELLKSKLNGWGEGDFTFLTNPRTGRFDGQIRSLLDKSSPDLYQDKDAIAGLKATNTNVASVLKAKSNFDALKRVYVANEVSQYGSTLAAGQIDGDIKTRFDQISDRIKEKTGEIFDITKIINNERKVFGGLSQLDAINVISQISQLVNERQSVIKLFSNAIKNLIDGIEINSNEDSKKSARAVLHPELNKKNGIPQILEHMIEDEDNDDYGFGSGKRFIIRDEQIKSLTIKEEPPKYTMVEVNGLYGEGLADLPSDQAVAGGNAQATAWAVDFDMCRMYGYREQHPVNAPYLSNPDTQCAPFAVFWLNRARAEIFQADLTIAGNEFIQPGEVYYIEDYNMLFYAESISHNYSFGSDYSTSLNLKFGHNPGEYIPTILDIVGKSLYTNKHQSDLLRHNRQGYAGGDVPIATIVYDPSVGGSNYIDDLVKGSYGDANRGALGNILLTAAGVLTKNSGVGKKAKIQLRTYYDTQKKTGEGADPVKLAKAIKSWLQNPVLPSKEDGRIMTDTSYKPISVDDVEIVSIDLSGSNSDGKEVKSPSSEAWSRARELRASSFIKKSATVFAAYEDGIQSKNTEVPFFELANGIVDIWATFTDINKTKGTTQNPSDQASSEETQRTIKEFASKVYGFTVEEG